ncbi:MAG: hypothetical protein KJ583_03300 [Nanoarchaeota archaeon]|nr:hypothetical protein [Nanoarchaeota archaeon]MBU1269404.1 hypothetical protein [Nanoarchaeota archaeon]MBU1604321.1 hypothetical protein [Nanoarchaeota archaeon]MBU2442933.1 hypothetical protein [Nanoarchaeota archaeon]
MDIKLKLYKFEKEYNDIYQRPSFRSDKARYSDELREWEERKTEAKLLEEKKLIKQEFERVASQYLKDREASEDIRKKISEPILKKKY